MKQINNVLYNDSCRLDMFLPDRKTYPVIVFFHGGGLDSCTHNAIPQQQAGQDYAKHGVGFVTVEYRMYPNAKYPDYLEDAAQAVRYVKNFMAQENNHGPLLVSGASAGAWMALMLCLNKEFLPDTEVDGWLIESPQTTSHFNIIKYELGLDPRTERIDRFAPLYYVNEHTSFSRMLLIGYDQDIPCRYEQNQLFIAAVKRFNQNADLEYIRLHGTHCQGSCETGDDGRYPINVHTIDWMRRKELLG